MHSLGGFFSNSQIKELANEQSPKSDAQQLEQTVDTANGKTAVDKAQPKDADVELASKPKSSLHLGLLQLRPLFVKPYLGLSLLVYLLNFCVLLG